MSSFKYFKREEFACNCGCGRNEIKDELITKLDEARQLAGVPFRINSGYRCDKHNAESGGAVESPHMSGFAADISTTDSRTRWLILESLVNVGFNRIGIGKTFVHADCDPNKDADVVWTYYGK